MCPVTKEKCGQTTTGPTHPLNTTRTVDAKTEMTMMLWMTQCKCFVQCTQCLQQQQQELTEWRQRLWEQQKVDDSLKAIDNKLDCEFGFHSSHLCTPLNNACLHLPWLHAHLVLLPAAIKRSLP